MHIPMARVLGPTEVQVEDFKVVELLDGAAIKKLAREFPGIRLHHICLYVEVEGSKELEHVTIGHETPKDEAASIATFTTEEPAVLEKLVKALLGERGA